MIDVAHYIASFAASPLAPWSDMPAWELTRQCEAIVRQLLGSIDASQHAVACDVAVHHTAVIEEGAVLKGPLIVGPASFVASYAYLRGGNWIAERSTIGAGVELKSSFVFAGSWRAADARRRGGTRRAARSGTRLTPTHRLSRRKDAT